MITDTIDLSIVRAEGFDHLKVGCYISINDQIQKVISPLTVENEENSFELLPVGILRLIVKSLSFPNEILGSVSLKLELLPKEGLQWLPLFKTAKDTIYELPDEVDSPKILLFMNSNKKEDASICHISSLSPVIELTESSEGENELEEILYLSKKNDCNLDISTNTLSNDKILKERKIYENSIEKDSNVFKTTPIKEIYKGSDLSKSDKENIYTLNKNEDSENELQKSKIKEVSLMQLLETKDKEIAQMNSQITSLKLTNLNLENEKKQWNSQQASKTSSKKIESLLKEIEILKQKLAKSETQKSELQANLQNMNPNDSFGEISKPKSVLDVLDENVTSFLRAHRIESYFSKQQELSYTFKGKRIYLSIQNNRIYCREGESISTIEDLIKNNALEYNLPYQNLIYNGLNSPAQTVHKRMNSNSILMESSTISDKSFENMNKSYCDNVKVPMQRSKSSRGNLQNVPILSQYRSKSPIITPLKDSSKPLRKSGKVLQKPPFK
ncbi:unnamed protein product [Blepharisma stoltei]|uniref:Uncharacterized protein n=1 Tax=Blepharisma stoltei TaxID=1481888 RepID=A0AAU9J190_9CILI|nr:unnamed protein product [Blepharisma stoltei]